MSWQLAVFCVLGVVIGGGIGWYERSRPPSRVVALVAALAALAVAGRLVLAPFPNVVATTDVALITGYALGAAPGFTVGALAALVSNFWLGQGPWTPWQMAGWGLVGIAGALLGRASGHRLGRVGLATACGLAGLAYGALLDLSVMVSYGGEQSLDRYLALSARGIPFNVAHAAGNIAIALAAGPALVRMISRYRTRFDFTWRPAGALPLVLALALLGAVAARGPGHTADAAPPAAPAGKSAGAALRWLAGAQNADGGFGATQGASSSLPMTGWAALGIEAGARNPLDVRRAGHSAIDFLRARAATLRSTGDLERTILVLEGAGVGPGDFGGADLVTALRSRRSHDGSFSGQVNLTAFGLLALRSAGASQAELGRSASWLRHVQNGDGGWGFRSDAPSDADSTGAALQGLAAAGVGGPAASDGVRFLRRVQRADGGFALSGSGSSNSQSTAWALQGVLAAGDDPSSLSTGGRSALAYLAARQAGDGHYAYSAASDQTPVWVTGQALLATNRKPLPLAAVPRAGGVARNGGGGSGGSGAGLDLGSGPGGGTHGDKRGGSGGRGTEVTGATSDGSGSHRSAGSSAAQVQGVPVSATGPVAGEPGDGGDDATPRVAAGLGALAAALGAGFLWYRRRLP